MPEKGLHYLVYLDGCFLRDHNTWAQKSLSLKGHCFQLCWHATDWMLEWHLCAKKKNWKCDSTTATKYAHNPLLVNPVPTLWQNIWQNCNEYCYKLHIWWICDAVGTRTCLKTQHLSWLFKATDPFLTSAPGNTGINLQMSFQ